MVSNLINDNGNAARNQFVIIEKNGKVVFQSYSTRVAYKKDDKVFIHPDALGPRDTYSPSSVTTRKHLYIFLRDYCGMSWIRRIDDLKAAVKSGSIKLSKKI